MYYKETFACPFCGFVRTASMWSVVYSCDTTCKSCRANYMAVDSLDRCKRCEQKVDCLLLAVVVCISSIPM
jgi:hypothetical protein